MVERLYTLRGRKVRILHTYIHLQRNCDWIIIMENAHIFRKNCANEKCRMNASSVAWKGVCLNELME